MNRSSPEASIGNTGNKPDLVKYAELLLMLHNNVRESLDDFKIKIKLKVDRNIQETVSCKVKSMIGIENMDACLTVVASSNFSSSLSPTPPTKMNSNVRSLKSLRRLKLEPNDDSKRSSIKHLSKYCGITEQGKKFFGKLDNASTTMHIQA
ncbi:unnamed protein product [Dimorphilus gyrociliatus]|uniref:Uncharacterized protein n=1 Tax=Dimorphilus gyrociliatus TaxID=2664684 RepID=A0A7I8VP95_9ANNE|nr:unnamed protein product [Dimorphilus gyrociliatus]